MKRKTFLFLYNNLNLGGIQKSMVNIIRQIKKDGNRIIWITTNQNQVDEGFLKDIEGIEIYQYNSKKYNSLDSLKIFFEKNEEVVGLAFAYREYCFLLRIKEKNKNMIFTTILWMPHFEGKSLFYEEYFPQPLKLFMKIHMKKQYKKLDKNDNIFYINTSHAKGLSSHYKFLISNLEKKIYTKPILNCKKEFNSEKIKERFKSRKFNILTLSRFSFPHKGYIIGLVKDFNELQKKYPNLTLTIAGYGEDEKILNDEIQKLDKTVQDKIFLIGKVEYDKLDLIFKEANLFIGVAGAVSDASRTGLISIPVRHNTYTCEGYGYSFKKIDMLTSRAKGKNIKFFIKQVLEMTEKEYLECSKKTFNTFNPKDFVKIGEHTLKLENTTNKIVISLYLEKLIERLYCFVSKFINIKKLIMKK